MIKKVTFILIIFLLFLQVEVHAISVGTLVKNSNFEVMRGDTAKFTILLWNSENSSFPVTLRATQVPEGLSVVINPKEFTINSSIVESYSTEGGIEYVKTSYGLMKTTAIQVLVKVSNSADLGDYKVYVNLAAGQPTTWISTVFDKTFIFNVKVVRYVSTTTNPNILQTLLNSTENIRDRITGMFTNFPTDSRLIFIAALMIGIFLFLWTIYKHE